MIITLSDYKQLTNTTNADGFDTYINYLIPVVNAEIESYCDRTFDLANYSQWFRLDPTRLLILNEYPVTDLIFLGSPVEVATITISSGDYTIEVKEDKITVINIRDINFASTDYTYATLPSLTLLKTEIEDDYPDILVNLVAGYELTNPKLLRPGIGLSWSAAYRVDCHAKMMPDTDRTIMFAEDTYFSYTLDFYFPENIFVMWKAGYTSATMPKDLQMIAANVVRDYIAISQKNGLGITKSESIGDYSITYLDYKLIKNIINGYESSLEGFVKKNL